MEYEMLHICGNDILASKREEKIFNGNKEITKKIIYTIPLELKVYKIIPDIIEINKRKFYKTDINKVNQKDFKLIEM